MKKLVVIAVVVPLMVLVLGAAIALYKHLMKPDPAPAPASDAIAISGGQPMQVRIKTPAFTQDDSRWATDTIGNTDEILQAVGCTVCATAMALSARGFAITPKDLNTKLTDQGGLTESGLLIWGAVRRVTGKKHAIVVDDRPTHAKLDAQLTKGNPIIAKVLHPSGIWHWILITGKDGTNYLMHDPLGKATAHEPMDRYSSGIFTIRYLK